MAEMIKLQSKIDGFEFGALHAPAQGTRRGGIVIIQEIFGLDKWVVEDVERWAAKGFEAIAPSMFDRLQPGYVADHDNQGFETGRGYAGSNGQDNPVSDAQACIDMLKDKGPVFFVGYCYGGTLAWRASALCSGIAAASSYYGGGVAATVSLQPKCPVICHFGRKDAHIPCDEVKAALAEAHPDVPVYIYDNSGHGFNNDGRPDSDLADAELARHRTLELFEANGAK